MNLKRFIGKCRRGLDVVNLRANPSYSQIGEDLIVNYLFNSINIQKPTYLEIGTNEPVIGNNTYFFYNKGCQGVCIEPNIELYKSIKKKRPNDTVLNIGMGLSNEQSATFYLFPHHLSGWNTFSETEARIRERESSTKAREISVALKNINDIIEKHFTPYPNFISIDVEGLDLEILQSLDFQKFHPEVICVETISFSTTNTEVKLQEIIDFVHSKGYFTYADTHVNTIFCRVGLLNHEK
jgi:FkbM family methyltransferase